MDPITALQGGETGPLTLGGFLVAIFGGAAYAIKYFMDQRRRESSENTTLANDSTNRVIAATVQDALTATAQVINTLQAQNTDSLQRFQTSMADANSRIDQLQKDMVSNRGLLDAATALNTKLTYRVRLLEQQMTAAGLTFPPDN